MTLIVASDNCLQENIKSLGHALHECHMQAQLQYCLDNR